MQIENKVKLAENVFEALDKTMIAFQQCTKLYCKSGCVKCCMTPNIAATIVEFLPFAYHLYQIGMAENWLDKLSEENSTTCVLLRVDRLDSGSCTQYPYRGLVCRLFGYAAWKNKYNQLELVSCRTIKNELEEYYLKASDQIKQGELLPPIMSYFYNQLYSIDFEMTNQVYPINTAIKKAIEIVLHYFSYR